MHLFGLGIPELAIILVAIAFLFFRGDKISETARGFGRFTGEFKRGKAEMEKETKKAEKDTK